MRATVLIVLFQRSCSVFGKELMRDCWSLLSDATVDTMEISIYT